MMLDLCCGVGALSLLCARPERERERELLKGPVSDGKSLKYHGGFHLGTEATESAYILQSL